MSNLQLSPQAAARELLARRKAVESLIDFTQYTNDLYRPAEHHKTIAHKLEQVEKGEITRLIICMPPRHGKSELASRRFPAWYLGRNPSEQIIAASYNADLANDFGREVRNIVNSQDYKNVFDVELAQDSKAANRWHTSKKGMYVAAGVGTAVTGRGANILLIDDPFKDRQEADSELQRQRVWDWYTSTAYTRLMQKGAIIVINTRWHDDDLTGRLLEAQLNGGDKWEVLSLSAIDDDGNALWPTDYPISRLEQIKGVLPSRDWNSLYQQDPIPDEGEYFKTEWFLEYDTLPDDLEFYGASDYAVTDGDGDYTEHGIFGIDRVGNLYLADWWFGKSTSDVWIDAKCDLIIKHKPDCWFGESGVIRRSIEPFLARRMNERNAICRIEWLASVAGKESRARGFQGMASMGKIFIPKNAIWKDHVMSQLIRFPAGKHDDAVDVCSLIGRGLEHINAKRAKYVAPKKAYVQHGWMG